MWQSTYGVASIRLVLFCVPQYLNKESLTKILEEESERYILEQVILYKRIFKIWCNIYIYIFVIILVILIFLD